MIFLKPEHAVFVLTKSKNSLKKYCHSTLIIPTQFIYRLKTQNYEFALPCYLQRLFTLQSLFVSSQIPECWWSQACVRLLNACQSKKKKPIQSGHLKLLV